MAKGRGAMCEHEKIGPDYVTFRHVLAKNYHNFENPFRGGSVVCPKDDSGWEQHWWLYTRNTGGVGVARVSTAECIRVRWCGAGANLSQ
jgi:hypothetical protein